jgi:hypothetical protein
LTACAPGGAVTEMEAGKRSIHQIGESSEADL